MYTRSGSRKSNRPMSRPIHHRGPCGERIPCPKHGPDGPYLTAERLANGTILAHDCGAEVRPWELPAFAWTAAR